MKEQRLNPEVGKLMVKVEDAAVRAVVLVADKGVAVVVAACDPVEAVKAVAFLYLVEVDKAEGAAVAMHLELAVVVGRMSEMVAAAMIRIAPKLTRVVSWVGGGDDSIRVNGSGGTLHAVAASRFTASTIPTAISLWRAARCFDAKDVGDDCRNGSFVETRNQQRNPLLDKK